MLKILSLHLGLGIISLAVNYLLVPNPIRWVLCILFSILYFVAGVFSTKKPVLAAAPIISLLPFLSRLIQIILGSIMFSHKIISDITIIPYGGSYAFTLATVDLLYTGHPVSAWIIRILGYLSPGILILIGYLLKKLLATKSETSAM